MNGAPHGPHATLAHCPELTPLALGLLIGTTNSSPVSGRSRRTDVSLGGCDGIRGCPAPSSASSGATRRSGPSCGAACCHCSLWRWWPRSPWALWRALGSKAPCGARHVLSSTPRASAGWVLRSPGRTSRSRARSQRPGRANAPSHWRRRLPCHVDRPPHLRRERSGPVHRARAARRRRRSADTDSHAGLVSARWRHAGRRADRVCQWQCRDRHTQRSASRPTRERSQNLSGHAAHRRPYRSRRAVGVQSQLEPGPRRRRARCAHRPRVPAERLRAQGFAARRPIADNLTEKRSRTQPPH